MAAIAGAILWFSIPDEARLSVEAVSGANPAITPPRPQWFPTMRVAAAKGWAPGAMPTPAAGLRVNAYATGLVHPRWLYRLPNGDVLVAETNAPPEKDSGSIKDWVADQTMKKAGADVPSPNRITLLRDADQDGVAEYRSTLIAGLNSPFGMALLGGYLYIGDSDALVRVPFSVGRVHITAKPEVVVKLPPGGHWARNVIVAPDGKSLFVTVGSSTNIAENGIAAEFHRAAVWKVDPRAKTFSIYAEGLRNPNGLAFEPHSGQLWTTVNERDMLGSDLAPDYMTHLEAGEHFGWPWYYWGGHQDLRVTPANPALRARLTRPDFALGPHTAALGLTFAAEARLGPAFANGAFVGEHGSWNRVPASGYKVVFIPFGTNGQPLKGGKPADVLTGFLDANGHAQGRPVGVTIDRTGALLVADDVGNIVWRVSR
ncbi:sorbosone dehydrogenase family protein [Sphingomonas oligophenolica]